MEDPDKAVELLPQEWKSEREKPRQPFFGSGAAPLLGELSIAAIALVLLILVFYLGSKVKDQAENFLFGTTPTAPQLEPGQSAVIDGVQVKRVK